MKSPVPFSKAFFFLLNYSLGLAKLCKILFIFMVQASGTIVGNCEGMKTIKVHSLISALRNRDEECELWKRH